eukprot:Ihof_evm9s187 gene=Ihof_evmTU9s187
MTRLLVLASLIGAAMANVPLLMWSSSATFSPKSSDSFSVTVPDLEEIIKKSNPETKVFVLYLHNKFSLGDFRSGGGQGDAFANLKRAVRAVDNRSSVALDEVKEGGERIKNLFKSMSGDNMVTIEDREQLDSLDFTKEPVFVLVPLADGKDNLAKNDELVAEVNEKVAKYTRGSFMSAWSASGPSSVDAKMNFNHFAKRTLGDAQEDTLGEHQN